MPGSSGAAFPPLDERLVRPETREEMVRGERMLAQPALEPHADQHFGLDYILGAHRRPEYVGSTDLITRVTEGSDFASDTCLRRAGTDEHKRRFLEEVVFEVVHEQPLRSVTVRAEDMIRRGVRRVFAIFVKKGEVHEWAPATGTWRPLAAGSSIEDPCLVRPLLVRAVLDAALADDEVARALEAKNNAAILGMKADSARQGELRGEERGELRATARAVLAVLESRGLAVPARVRATIEGSVDLERLRTWLTRAAVAASADVAVDEP